jgi:hypothetical protein
MDSLYITAFAQFGLAGLVVWFTMQRDKDREARMSTALEEQRKWVQEKLISVLERNTAALENLK